MRIVRRGTVAGALAGILLAGGAAGAGGTLAEAQARLKEFVQPGADYAALSVKLRPTQQDYGAVFKPEAAAKLMASYDPAWEQKLIVVKPKPGQTAVLVWGATSEEIQGWQGNARDHFPGGYQNVAPHLKPGVTLYAFKFVEPGKTLGMAYDGLAFVNGQWRLFPKPFRAFQTIE
jgi:hypothetical protein